MNTEELKKEFCKENGYDYVPVDNGVLTEYSKWLELRVSKKLYLGDVSTSIIKELTEKADKMKNLFDDAITNDLQSAIDYSGLESGLREAIRIVQKYLC